MLAFSIWTDGCPSNFATDLVGFPAERLSGGAHAIISRTRRAVSTGYFTRPGPGGAPEWLRGRIAGWARPGGVAERGVARRRGGGLTRSRRRPAHPARGHRVEWPGAATTTPQHARVCITT